MLLPVALNYKLQLLCRWNTRTKGKDKLTEWKEEQGREKGEQVRKKRGRARESVQKQEQETEKER